MQTDFDTTRAAARVTAADGSGEYVLTTAHGWLHVQPDGEVQRAHLDDVLAACGRSDDYDEMDRMNRLRWDAVSATVDVIKALFDSAVSGEAANEASAREVAFRLVEDLADGNILLDTRMQGAALRRPISADTIRDYYYKPGQIVPPVQYLGRSPLQTRRRLEEWDDQRPGHGWRGRRHSDNSDNR